MIDFAAHRAKLDTKIKAITRAKAPAEAAESRCEHAWQKYRLTVHPYRSAMSQPVFKGLGAYFVVLACAECREKKFIDYVVER